VIAWLAFRIEAVSSTAKIKVLEQDWFPARCPAEVPYVVNLWQRFNRSPAAVLS
jgi:hypothetical protein